MNLLAAATALFLFANPDAAALSALQAHNGRAAAGAVLATTDSEGLTRFTFTPAERESGGKFSIHYPPGTHLAGIYQRRPADQIANDRFTEEDMALADRLGVPFYVYFQGRGQTRVYRPHQTPTHIAVIAYQTWRVSDGERLLELQTETAGAPAPEGLTR
jgi:hypothetical protein